MWGGRGEDDEVDEGMDMLEAAGGGRGHGEVLVGAGSSGGGEDSVGDPSVDSGGVLMLFGPRFPSSSSVSMTIGSGAPAASA